MLSDVITDLPTAGLIVLVVVVVVVLDCIRPLIDRVSFLPIRCNCVSAVSLW